MDVLDQLFPFDRFSANGLTLLADWGTIHLATFLLVTSRLAGMVVVATRASTQQPGWPIRIFLILTLAGVLTPLVTDMPNQSPAAGPIQLANAEVEQPNAIRAEDLLSLMFLKDMLGEAVFGAALGFGILIVISSLQMAGELIDPQCGLQGERLFQVGSFSEGSLSGRLLVLVGLMAFLVMPAEGMGTQGGLMLLVRSFLETFETVPVGAAVVSTGFVDVLIALIHHSIALCLLVAAPVLACATLISLLIGLASRAVPEVNHQSYATPLRTMCCLAILAFSLSGAAGILTREIPAALQQIQSLLTT